MTSRPRKRYRAAAGTPRRQPRVRRASGGITPVRAAAILTMIAAAGAVFGLATTPAFAVERLDVRGTLLTPEDAVRAAAAIEPGANLVSLSTEPIVERIRQLPAVRGASVELALPGTVEVTVVERRAVVVWQIADRRFAVDETGRLFADVTSDPSGATVSIPVVVDERAAAGNLSVTSALDPTDLDAATRLGSLTPSQVRSSASTFRVHITDERGFTLSSGSGGWVAVFGFYFRSQRTPALIPGQVQLLASFLAGREDQVATVILADDHDGTYIPKATPKSSATPRPSAQP
jgi:cell division septal protein FtsQ